MKLNRRNFIKTIGVALAAAVTRKWPAIEWPEPVRRAGRIIYVNTGRGKDDLPEDGLTPETAYHTFAPAIDAVSPGRTIDIGVGCYWEEVVIDEDSITLIGSTS